MTSPAAGDRPPLTVITAVRNDLAGLRRTYASLRGQTWCAFRWLVVDGASVDGSVAWLAGLDEPRLQLVSEPDRSHFDAMNKGIGRLETDYCLFLNAGDAFVDDSVLERVLPVLASDRPALAYGRARIGAVPGFAERTVGRRIRRRWELFFWRIPCHQALFLSRAVFDEFRPYDTSLALFGDTDWILGYSRRHPPAEYRFFDFEMVHYDPHGKSYVEFFRHAPEYLRVVTRWGNPLQVAIALVAWGKAACYAASSRALGFLGLGGADSVRASAGSGRR